MSGHNKFHGLHWDTMRGGNKRALAARIITGRAQHEFIIRRSLADAGAWVLLQVTETMLDVTSTVQGAEFPDQQAAINHANLIGRTIWETA